MKTIAHVSDLHFGREDPKIVEGLLASLDRCAADVIVVSGDLTQRAKKKQFRAAKQFLDAMPQVPRVVVPGNHDVSTTNLFERVVRPLKRYKRFITPDLSPFWTDGEIAIAGINTVRLLSTKDGRINRAQVELACSQLQSVPEAQVRIVVTHQPIDVPMSDRKHPPLTRAGMAVAGFAACGVDLFLSGHLHVGLALATAVRHPMAGYTAVVVHAGTAVSTRTRKQPNGWNLIHVSADRIEIEPMQWNGKRFACTEPERYAKGGDGWSLAIAK